MIRKNYLAAALVVLPLAFSSSATAQAQARTPNIVMIMADDVGIWNISACQRGMCETMPQATSRCLGKIRNVVRA